MRCASPPERVEASRSSVMYSRPTASRKCNLCCCISLRTPHAAISSLLPAERESGKKLIGVADGEGRRLRKMLLPPRRTAARFGRVEARSLAFRTQRVAAIFTQHNAHVKLVLLAFELSEESAHSGKGSAGTVAVEHEFLLRRRQFAPRFCSAECRAGPRPCAAPPGRRDTSAAYPGIDRAGLPAASSAGRG